MNQICYNLNLPIPLFKEGINPFSFSKERHTILDIDKVLNLDIIEWFSNFSLKIISVEVFYSPPSFISGIHADCNAGDINKINWVFGGENCKMNWYSIKHVNASQTSALTSVETDYIPYRYSDVDLLHSEVLKSPSLVHVGMPHNVSNSMHDRWCVSIVYADVLTNKRPTMEESVNLFKSYIK
jgi:hypothetical protein